jgi:hypothetical protein
MSLDMRGQVDSVFKSVTATRTTTGGGDYVNGIWQPAAPTTQTFIANLQPASDREIDFLIQGGERVIDARRLYINSGDLSVIDQTGDWEFLNQRWKTVKCDNRPWRNYCKLIVSLYDDQ